MSIARGLRLAVVLILLVIAVRWVWLTKVDAARASLFVAAVIGAVTTIYVLVTYEILLENQVMAKATKDSSLFMERSVRFSHSPNLIYQTISTKDPTFSSSSVSPIPNTDYNRALTEFNSGREQKEFVFAVVNNKGQGAATNLNIAAVYQITDSSSPNRESTVTKHASIQILEAGKGVALCIFISKVPTSDDRVNLVSAHLTTSDFYRDAINEPAQQIDIDTAKHHVEIVEGGVVHVG